MIKILFFIPTLGHGGAERVLVNLVNHMDPTKFDITVQTMFDVGIYRDQLSPKVRYLGGLKWYFRGNTHVFKLFSPKTLYRYYIREHYDIIVAYLEGPSARVVSGCTDPRTRLISWIHITMDRPRDAILSFRSQKEARMCYRRFDRVAAVSRTVADSFAEHFPQAAAPEVIYNTIDTDKIREQMAEPVDDIVFPKNEIKICSVAKLMKTKGFDRLVPILQHLLRDGIPAHIYLIGVGEERKHLEKMVRAAGVEKHWTFVGFRRNPYQYVRNCDLYVCSSRREGFSTAVTEALIAGVPVVSTRCSGAEELLGSHDEYGIVTDNDGRSLEQGVRRILTEDGLLAEYREKAAERGRFFDQDKTVADAESLFAQVVRQ